MAGRMGNVQVTVRKLTIIRVDTEQNLLLIKGAVPGKAGALVNVVPEKKVGR
jgi:large subunit ribosomal protein L3